MPWADKYRNMTYAQRNMPSADINVSMPEA